MIARATFDSPVGLLTVTEQDGCITALDWGGQGRCGTPTPLLSEAGAQLDAYFAQRLERFDLPISFPSSPFLHGVMEALFSIPYGMTKTYGDIAEYVEGSPQAVGRACGANPVPIIIPCHRVLGATTLGGFSGRGGVETKIWLLKHEGAAGLLL
ncbi:MAG: methylated-DNA--[protein]-cysteine S-methyltransferase [Rhodobacteraceae bacterium]|nr:methylated-DNA--[protein]-cysteine S-methyltransferase [Paracoccaceae bacterium]